jgi:PAS domain S-box-containing protein
MSRRYEYTPYIWPMLAVVALAVLLAIYSFRRRLVPGARPFLLMMAFTAFDAIGAALVLAAADMPTKIFWEKFQTMWKLPAVTAGLWFGLEYANLDRWLTRRLLALLAVPPLLVLLLGVTNDVHHWMWTGFVWEESFVGPVNGPANWVFIGYGVLLALANPLVFLWLFIRSPMHRWPAGLCIAGQIAARAAYVLDQAGRNPFAPMDPYIFGAAFTCMMYAVALFHFQMLSLLPVARGTVIEQMREGVLLVDQYLRIIDVNPAAERILGATVARVKGKHAVELLPAISESRDLISFPDKARSETTLGIGGSSQYAVHLSELKGAHGHRLGSLILLHDITEQTRAQAQILEQQRALATLRERDRVARELHDSIGQVLGYVKLQAQAARQLLARGRISEADGYLAQLAAAAQDAHADVREYILGARSAGSPFVPALEEFLGRFNETYGIAAKLSVEPGFTGAEFEPMVAAQLFRIIQETLTNVRKHARASGVSVRLAFTDSRVEATVQDDGVGFDPEVLDAAAGQHFGLHFMRERAEEVGGTVELRSAPGEGATVIVRVPARKERA